MNETYLKPKAELIDFDLEDRIMDGMLDDSWEIGDDDEEGV